MDTPNPFLKKNPAHLAAIRQIKAWTQERFSLRETDVVSVVELACTLPGCPPLDTVVTFWTSPETRHHFRIFKAALDVVEEDLPPYWMKERLIIDEIMGCPCC